MFPFYGLISCLIFWTRIDTIDGDREREIEKRLPLRSVLSFVPVVA